MLFERFLPFPSLTPPNNIIEKGYIILDNFTNEYLYLTDVIPNFPNSASFDDFLLPSISNFASDILLHIEHNARKPLQKIITPIYTTVL